RLRADPELCLAGCFQSKSIELCSGIAEFERTAFLIIDMEACGALQLRDEGLILLAPLDCEGRQWRRSFHLPAWSQHARSRPTGFSTRFTLLIDGDGEAPLGQAPGNRQADDARSHHGYGRNLLSGGSPHSDRFLNGLQFR